MSILKPISYSGAWEFKRPVPCPVSDIAAAPQVSISFNEDWIPAVMSAMKALTRPEAYEGTSTDINRCTADSHQLFDWTSTTKMQIGTIIATVLGVLPSNWLACDGATYHRVDYPELYAGLASAFIVDADHFTVPDLRGRTVLGVGTGSGLTTRAVNDSGGSEKHALSQAELAAHQHDQYIGQPNNPWGRIQASYLTGAGGAPHTYRVNEGSSRTDNGILDTLTTGNIGSGTAHENMQPWRAITYAIVAK